MRRLAFVFLILVAAVLAAVAWAGGAGEPAATAQARKGLTPLQQKLMSGFASRALDQRTAVGRLAPQTQRMRQVPGGVGSTSETGCPVESRRQRARQPELPEPDRPRPAGPRPGAERDGDRAGPEQPEPRDRRLAERLPARRRQLLRAPTRATAAAPGRTRRRRWASRAATTFGGVRAPVLAGGRRHVGRLGHEGQRVPVVPDVHARRRRCRNNPDQSSAFYVFRSTGNDGASWNFPARPVAELNDVAGAGDALLDKQYMTSTTTTAARSRTAST